MSPKPEKPIKLQTFDDRLEALQTVGREVCGLIRMKEFQRAPAVLGLPSGELWTSLYQQALQLVGHAGKGGLNFGKVITFNMAELSGLGPDDEPSMNAWIRSTFVGPTEIERETAHALDARLEGDELERHCAAYEERIASSGKLSIAIVRLGCSGRLGLNEPGSAEDSQTRKVSLSDATREELAQDFEGLSIPGEAVTMGVQTIRAAERVRILAFGKEAADFVRRTLADPPSSELPSTFIRGHKDCQILMDREAAG